MSQKESTTRFIETHTWLQHVSTTKSGIVDKMSSIDEMSSIDASLDEISSKRKNSTVAMFRAPAFDK